MAEPTGTSAVVGVATLTTAMSMMPLGVSLTTLVIGGACYFGGSAARTGFKLSKALEGSTEPVNAARAFAALLCNIPIAAVASCVTFLAAHVIGLQADAALGGLLLVTGFRGPEGIQWLMDTFTNIFTRVVPGWKPPKDQSP